MTDLKEISEYYPNDSIQLLKKYTVQPGTDKKQGLYREWYPNDQLRCMATYDADTVVGLARWYDEDGTEVIKRRFSQSGELEHEIVNELSRSQTLTTERLSEGGWKMKVENESGTIIEESENDDNGETRLIRLFDPETGDLISEKDRAARPQGQSSTSWMPRWLVTAKDQVSQPVTIGVIALSVAVTGIVAWTQLRNPKANRIIGPVIRYD